MRHYLKIWPIHRQRVFDGTKTFEIRKNDRAFQKGDTVVLQAWDPDKGHHILSCSVPDLEREIGDVYPIDAERVVFSLLPVERP